MFKTDTNLQAAFASECQAYVRYSLFAGIAQQEGRPEAARLFRTAAEAELVHARNHFTVMGGMGNTKSNLLAGATTEQTAVTSMYPSFLEQALEDRNEGARLTFEWALEAERNHNVIFEKAYKLFKETQTLNPEKYFYCTSCGNMFVGEAPGSCGVCKQGAEKIKQV